jgi:2-polyprenyl-3-methyl-5-hydroxy-6-metoxy-1,4-benzoquinol methylase
MWKDVYGNDEVEYVACPLCGSSQGTDVAVEWSLIISRCNICGMEFVRRRLRNPEWSYRRSDSSILEKYRSVIEGTTPHLRTPNYAQVLDQLEPFRGVSSRLLDVGAHIGFFMREAARRGWEVVGVEQSPDLAALAREHMGLDVRTGYLEDFSFDREFDVVTFTDVLEHIAGLVAILNDARAALRPRGVVLAKVPHVKWNRLKSRTIKRVRGRVDAFDAREHLNQFRKETLEKTFRHAGLEPIKLIVPTPVQEGSSVKRALRWSTYALGRAASAVPRAPTALSPDLLLIGRVVEAGS